jgi:cation:H+ antiporter
VGSNIFNLMAVLGLSSTVAPAGLAVSDAMLAFDLPVMVAVAVACLPIFATGHLIARWEAALFVAYYVAYTGYLILAATRHDALGGFVWVMGTFVIPLTGATIFAVTWRAWRRQRRP